MNSNILNSLREYEDKLYDMIIELDRMESNLKIYSEVEDRQLEKNSSNLEKEELLELRSNRNKLLSASLRIETAHSLVELVHNDILDLVGEVDHDDEDEEEGDGLDDVEEDYEEEDDEEDESDDVDNLFESDYSDSDQDDEEDEESEDEDDSEEDEESEDEGPESGLVVYLPDDTYLQEESAAATFARAIDEAGFENVIGLNKKLCGLPLVSRRKPNTDYAFRKLSRYYVITHISNANKKKILQQISDELDLDWDVEIL